MRYCAYTVQVAGLFLAMRTIISASLGDDGFLNWISASLAGAMILIVNMEGLLEIAWLAIGFFEVFKCGSASSNRLFKYFFNGITKRAIFS